MGALLSRTREGPYAVSADMQEVIAENKWMDLLGRREDARVIDVDLASVPYDDRALGFRFKLEYCPRQPSGVSRVAILFPNLKGSGSDETRVLYTDAYSGSYASLDAAINERLRGSIIDSVPVRGALSSLKLAVCSGDHVFRIWNVTGNIYMCWLRVLHIFNTSGVCQMPLNNVPLLVETDGRMGYRSLVHFNYVKNEKQVLDALNIRGNTAGYIPVVDAQTMFNCDDDPRSLSNRTIQTVSRYVAADRVAAADVSDVLMTMQGQDFPTDDEGGPGSTTGGGGASNSDAEYGGTTLFLELTTPRRP
jgi:hypothetical protein